MSRLPRRFFAQPTLEVARALLGQRLVRLIGGRRLAGLITETEAYIGQTDLACHARVGRTGRTEVMFGPPGRVYVYFNYGLHWMLNLVTEADGFPAAVLIRGLLPTEGQGVMRGRRGRQGAAPLARLTDGPAKLAQALAIDRALNGHDLCARSAALFVEAAPAVPEAQVQVGPRIGLNQVPEPWHSAPWNFKASPDRLN